MNDDLATLLRPELAELSSYVPAEPPGISARLDANEAPPHASPRVAEAVARAVSKLALERYPDARQRELKARIAERTGARADDLLIGTGSDEVISLVLTALARPRRLPAAAGASPLAKPDYAPQATMLTATPTFVMYRVTARGHGFKPIEVPLDKEWDLDAASMLRAIEMTRPNVVFIASPNNPTGNRMSEGRLREVIEHAHDSLVIVDEAYIDYAREPSLRSWRAQYPHLGILRTLSKVGLAALRIGWLEADEALVREIDKVRQPFNVSALAQAAASTVLADAWDEVTALVGEVVKERARVSEAIAKLSGFRVTPSDANFVWVRTPVPAATVYAQLVAKGVLVRSFHAAGGRMTNQLRITIGRVEENDRLLEGLASCG